MSFVFLLSSGGILLVHTFCSCTNEEIASLFVAPDHCHHSTELSCTTDDCCSSHQETADCCENHGTHAHHEHQEINQPDCEKSDFTYLKITNTFLSQETLQIKVHPSLMPVLVLLHASNLLPEIEDITPNEYTRFYSPPIHKTIGRDFVIHHQCFKLPHLA